MLSNQFELLKTNASLINTVCRILKEKKRNACLCPSVFRDQVFFCICIFVTPPLNEIQIRYRNLFSLLYFLSLWMLPWCMLLGHHPNWTINDNQEYWRRIQSPYTANDQNCPVAIRTSKFIGHCSDKMSMSAELFFDAIIWSLPVFISRPKVSVLVQVTSLHLHILFACSYGQREGIYTSCIGYPSLPDPFQAAFYAQKKLPDTHDWYPLWYRYHVLILEVSCPDTS